jgi:hypothetical protein
MQSAKSALPCSGADRRYQSRILGQPQPKPSNACLERKGEENIGQDRRRQRSSKCMMTEAVSAVIGSDRTISNDDLFSFLFCLDFSSCLV